MNRKTPYTVYLDPGDITALEAISKKSGERVSALIRQAVQEFLRKEEAA